MSTATTFPVQSATGMAVQAWANAELLALVSSSYDLEELA
jgi:hypothetical protein